jgi:hypothetical protein
MGKERTTPTYIPAKDEENISKSNRRREDVPKIIFNRIIVPGWYERVLEQEKEEECIDHQWEDPIVP